MSRPRLTLRRKFARLLLIVQMSHYNCIMSLNQSSDLSKVRDHETVATPKNEYADEFSSRVEVDPNRKKYGKMVVLLETDHILITLGPDYLCFVPAFIGFILAGIFLIIMVNQAFENILLKAGNFIFVVIQVLSYLAVAVSNPGIVLEQNLPSQENQQDVDIKRYCRKCRIHMQKNMHHCKSCDVCIRDYDHHCPWVSKCIGGSNLTRFYFFVGITPFFIIYYMIMVMICFALTAARNNVK